MTVPHAFKLVGSLTWAVILLLPPSVLAFDSLWSSVLEDSFLPSTAVEVKVLSFQGAAGFQMLTASALDRSGTRFRVGLGYVDMITAEKNPLDGSPLPLGISDRWFLLNTRLDQRFQFTLEIRW